MLSKRLQIGALSQIHSSCFVALSVVTDLCSVTRDEKKGCHLPLRSLASAAGDFALLIF